MSEYTSKTSGKDDTKKSGWTSNNSLNRKMGPGGNKSREWLRAQRGRNIFLDRKLKVGSSNAPQEKEADDVAEKVMRMPDSDKNTIRRQGMDEEEELVSRKETSGESVEVSSETQGKIESARGGGQSLSDSEKAFFEPRFGRTFLTCGCIRIRTRLEASQDINARAFTIGNDVFFNKGEYKPGTGDGRFLMAHELTHTVQQGGGGAKGVQRDVIRRQEVGGRSWRKIKQDPRPAYWIFRNRKRLF